MATGKYGLLNVVAHPHISGTYRRIFEKAANDSRGVRFHGDRFATISPLSADRNGVFTGRLATWTEIDENSNLIEKTSLKESLLEDSDFKLPDDVGFNSKVFSFAFRIADHRLFIELLNDENTSISVGRAKLAFEKVLQAFLPSDIESLDVYIVPSQNAVDRVLQLPGLKRLEIQLELPNPDDLSEEKRKLLKEIEELGAKRIKSEIFKRAGEESLHVTPRYRAMAELAQDNGYVSATGFEHGDTVRRSTKEYPTQIQVELPTDASRAIHTRVIAESNE